MMNNYKGLLFSFIACASSAFAGQEPAANPFDKFDDAVCTQIFGRLDHKSAAAVRRTCRRFNSIAWSHNPIAIKQKRAYETESEYWARFIALIERIEKLIANHSADNDILVRRTSLEFHPELSLPDKLATMKHVRGLATTCYDEEQTELAKLPYLLPNLKILELDGGDSFYIKIPDSIYRLTKLQKIRIYRCPLDSMDLTSLPESLTKLSLIECQDCDISAVPENVSLPSLRSLTLMSIGLIEEEWENLFRIAPNIEKLRIRNFSLIALPYCMARLQKLEELDLWGNDLDPEALRCLTTFKNLRRINLTHNEKCESKKDIVRSMFPETVTITYALNKYDMDGY